MNLVFQLLLVQTVSIDECIPKDTLELRRAGDYPLCVQTFKRNESIELVNTFSIIFIEVIIRYFLWKKSIG